MNITNPLLYGLFGFIITYLIIMVEIKLENKKYNLKNSVINEQCQCPELKLSIKIPLLIGVLVWLSSYILLNNKPTDILSSNSVVDSFVYPEFTI